jgi:hypothetical protein
MAVRARHDCRVGRPTKCLTAYAVAVARKGRTEGDDGRLFLPFSSIIESGALASTPMLLYALVEAGDPVTIDVYLTEEQAQRALDDCLRDEPEWRGLLRVEEIEFAGAQLWRN